MMRMTCELTAVTPIAHGDTHSGINNTSNIRLFMRSAQSMRGAAVLVPDISTNALRTVLFRRPLHDHLLERLAIERGSLSRGVLNLLYSGGSMSPGAQMPGSIGEMAVAIRQLYPSLGLLGGSVDRFILPQSIMRVSAWPIAREYIRAIDAVAPHLVDEAKGVSAFDLVSEETRTRGTGSESEGNQMIYTYETLAAGARFFVELTLDVNADHRHMGAVALAIQRWDGYFGGQGRQGRGRMLITHLTPAAEATPYLDHIAANAEQMRAGLLDGRLGCEQIVCTAAA